jgi:geranylgeranyl diphosphate synthase type II
MLNHVYRESRDSDRERLAAILALPRQDRTHADIAWIRRLMDAHGSVEYGALIAHGLAGAALHEYEGIFGRLPDSPDKRFVEGLVTWVFERT